MRSPGRRMAGRLVLSPTPIDGFTRTGGCWACRIGYTEYDKTNTVHIRLCRNVTWTLPGPSSTSATAVGEEEVGAVEQGDLRRPNRPSPTGVQQPQGQPPPPHPSGQGNPRDLAGEALAEPLPDRGGEALPGAELSHHRHAGVQGICDNKTPY